MGYRVGVWGFAVSPSRLMQFESFYIGGNMKKFVEKEIINAIRKLLTCQVNEVLGAMEWNIPLFEISEYRGSIVVVPMILLKKCERTEKERIIKLDTYSVQIKFNVLDFPESENNCYAYSYAISKIIDENPTLNEIVTKAEITSKEIIHPKVKSDYWEIVVYIKIVNERGLC